MERRTISRSTTSRRAPRSPLVAANFYEARNLYEARVARQREERAARYAARVARAEAREAATRPPPSPPSPLPQAPVRPPPPHPQIRRRPLVTICDNGTIPLRPPPPHFSVPFGSENAPPFTTTSSRSPRHNRSSTDRVVGPYTILRRLR